MRSFTLLILVLSVSTAAAQDSASPKCRLEAGITDVQGRAGLCGFDVTRRRFAGSPSEQARCLLRQVKQGAQIGTPNAPERLTARAGAPTPFTRHRLESYVTARGIHVGDVWLDDARQLEAEYFVIHDTSSPNCSALERPNASCPIIGALPPLLNHPQWPINQTFDGHKPLGKKAPRAHAWTNRVGESIVEVPLRSHISHMKFDYCHDARSKRGLFIGVENIQPRIGEPAIPEKNKKPNDLIAPVPGFTDLQYARLALLYAAASVRRGHWLIPGFHAVIDSQYEEGHDDPQNFDVGRFDQALEALITDIETGR